MLPEPVSHEIGALANAGWTSPHIADYVQQPIEVVQRELLDRGIDWAARRPGPGRPQKPLLAGQALFVERAYHLGKSQSWCATRVNATITRVRRHLVEGGVKRPGRNQNAPAALLTAVRMYLDGVPVMKIVEETGVRPPPLYAALKERDVPLRLKRT